MILSGKGQRMGRLADDPIHTPRPLIQYLWHSSVTPGGRPFHVECYYLCHCQRSKTYGYVYYTGRYLRGGVSRATAVSSVSRASRYRLGPLHSQRIYRLVRRLPDCSFSLLIRMGREQDTLIIGLEWLLRHGGCLLQCIGEQTTERGKMAGIRTNWRES